MGKTGQLILWAFNKVKPAKNESPQSDTALGTAGAEGEFRAFNMLWLWTFPLLSGLLFGWLCMVFLEVMLARQNNLACLSDVVTMPVSRQQETESANMSAFLKSNPFKITPMPDKQNSSTPLPVPMTESLMEAVLLWPIDNVGVVMNVKGQQRVVLLSNNFDDYILEAVDSYSAVFVKDGERKVKELRYGPSGTAESSSAVFTAVRSPVLESKRQAAEPTPAPGVIGRDMINQLLENPMEELGSIRLRPSMNETGLQIQWLANRSVLSQAGVRRNDVMQSINGIPIRNAMDIGNCISSMLNSDRFDIEVMRGGARTILQNAVQ